VASKVLMAGNTRCTGKLVRAIRRVAWSAFVDTGWLKWSSDQLRGLCASGKNDSGLGYTAVHGK
jgi:hypothetical protein